MVTKRVLIAIRGGNEEGKKMGGKGRGKTLWSLKGFQLPHMRGNRKPFDCHAIMATENFSVAITCGNQKPFDHHM